MIQFVSVPYDDFVRMSNNSQKCLETQYELAQAKRDIEELVWTCDEYDKFINRQANTIEALDEVIDLLWEDLELEKQKAVEEKEPQWATEAAKLASDYLNKAFDRVRCFAEA